MTVQRPLAPGKHKLRVEEYLLLADAGVFGDARTELIDGDIIIMAPEFRPHAYTRGELEFEIRQALRRSPSDLYVSSGSVHMGDSDMPQPDIVLTREPKGTGAIPLASVELLVEVSVTTLREDRTTKLALYAASGVAEYWIVDVNGREITQLWSPAGRSYRESRTIGFGEPLTAATNPAIAIDTDGLT